MYELTLSGKNGSSNFCGHNTFALLCVFLCNSCGAYDTGTLYYERKRNQCRLNKKHHEIHVLYNMWYSVDAARI